MVRSLNNIIENNINISNLEFYSVIIGTKPSKGARSPLLWNKVYKFEGKKIRMIPLDVKEKKLEYLFRHLEEDQYCLGGAIAVPYKEKVLDLIKNNVSEQVKAIGAVNCIYRKTTGKLVNKFTGTNTDGEAALEPIKEYLTKNENLSVGLLGFGGAGKAILAFLLKYFKGKHSIKVFIRNTKNLKDAKSIGINAHSFNDLEAYVPDFDLIINSTSAGHVENIHTTPVSEKLLERAKKTMIVYDIIYDPLKTLLLKDSEKLGLKTINGLRMNLFQAVLAYSYTNKTNLSLEDIYKIMN